MKFILTQELGRLAKWLRILGYDCVYFKQVSLSSLLIQALRDNRIILTRNLRLVDKARGCKVIEIKADKVSEQLKQVLGELQIKPDSEKMFSRCILCNEELVNIDKEKIKDKVPEYVFNTQEEFFTCPSCQRIYWPGTHWGNVQVALKEIKINPKSQ